MPHIHELIDYTVEVFIVFNDKVLLRKHDKYGIWLSVGGHIELHEDPNEAAVREVMEEVGLSIVLDDSLRIFVKNAPNYKELIPPYFLNRHRISEGHEHVTLTYFAKSNNDAISVTTRGEGGAPCKWFTKAEIEQNQEIEGRVKIYALRSLAVLSK